MDLLQGQILLYLANEIFYPTNHTAPSSPSYNSILNISTTPKLLKALTQILLTRTLGHNNVADNIKNDLHMPLPYNMVIKLKWQEIITEEDTHDVATICINNS